MKITNRDQIIDGAILGIDSGRTSEFMDFIDRNEIPFHGAVVDIREDGKTYIEADYRDNGKIEITLDRESGHVEQASGRFIFVNDEREQETHRFEIHTDAENGIERMEYYGDNGRLEGQSEVHFDGADVLSRDSNYFVERGQRDFHIIEIKDGDRETTTSEMFDSDGHITRSETTETYKEDGHSVEVKTIVNFNEDGDATRQDIHKVDESGDIKITSSTLIEYGADGEEKYHRDTETREITYFNGSEMVCDSYRRETVTTPEYTQHTETIDAKNENKFMMQTDYVDGRIDVREGDVERHYDKDGELIGTSYYQYESDSGGLHIYHYDSDGKLEKVESSEDWRIGTVRMEYPDENGRVDNREILDRDGNVIQHVEISYDGDRVTETIYNADGNYEGTSVLERIDDNVVKRTDIDYDGNERTTIVLKDDYDTKELSLESVVDNGDSITYCYSQDSGDAYGGDKREYISLTYDTDGTIKEKIIGEQERVLTDVDGEFKYGDLRDKDSHKTEYHSDGSRTETHYMSYSHMDTEDSRSFIEEYDAKGDLKREIEVSSRQESKDGPVECGIRIIEEGKEYGLEGDVVTTIEDVDKEYLQDAIDNPDNYERTISYYEDGERTSEFVEAGVEFPQDDKDAEQAPDGTDATDGDLTPDGQDDGELEPYETDGELFHEIEDGLRDGAEPTPEDGQDSKDDTEKPDKPEDTEYYQEDFDWYDTDGNNDDE